MKNRAFAVVMMLALIICVCAGCASNQDELNESTLDNESITSEIKNEADSNINPSEKPDTSLDTENPDKSDAIQDSETGSQNAEEYNNNDSNSNTVKIVFQDEDGNVLKSDEIEIGNDAVPPEEPQKAGYKFKGWNYDYEDVQTDLTVVPVFEEITEPSIVVKNVTVEAGDKIGVAVSVVNNPGFLGMVTNIQYDEGALELTDVSNGSIMGDYTFTPPKNMKSGCNAAWNINDMPEGELNGEIMVLHFKLLNKVTSGDYSVTVSCLNNAFDNSYNAFSFDTVSGSVKIR